MVMPSMQNEPLTAEQLAELKIIGLNSTHPESWIWNEDKLSYVAPIDAPNDGYPYLWDEEAKAWVAFPGYPRE